MNLTIRDILDDFPEMYNFNYKWDDEGNPAVYLEDVLRERGYDFKYEEDREGQCDYNDIKGYLNVEIIEL